MSAQVIGYIILFGFGALFLGISTLVSKRYSTEGVDDLVAAGRTMPFGMIAASSMVSWVWTVTLIGSAEAGFIFGINGGFNYAWGAAVPFFCLYSRSFDFKKKDAQMYNLYRIHT